MDIVKKFSVVSNKVDGSECLNNNLKSYTQASQYARSALEKGHSSVKIVINIEKESINNDPNKPSSS